MIVTQSIEGKNERDGIIIDTDNELNCELETYCSAIFVIPNILYILIINKIDNNL